MYAETVPQFPSGFYPAPLRVESCGLSGFMPSKQGLQVQALLSLSSHTALHRFIHFGFTLHLFSVLLMMLASSGIQTAVHLPQTQGQWTRSAFFLVKAPTTACSWSCRWNSTRQNTKPPLKSLLVADGC